MDEYLKLVVLGLSMATGMCLILRYGKRWFSREPPADMLAWMGEIERASAEMLRDDLLAVQSKARFFNLIGSLPRDFDPTAFLMANVAANAQRAVLDQAEREGLIPEGMLDKIYGKRTQEQAPQSEPTLRLVEDDEDDSAARWVGNQLVPKARKRL